MSEPEAFDFILDTWALLAHLGDETGAGRVRVVLRSAEKNECKAGISIINLGEVAYITERERGLAKVHKVLGVIRSLPVTVLPVGERIVMMAAHIKASHRLSYADAFAAATAKLTGGKLLTGDPELKKLDGADIKVEWLLK